MRATYKLGFSHYGVSTVPLNDDQIENVFVVIAHVIEQIRICCFHNHCIILAGMYFTAIQSTLWSSVVLKQPLYIVADLRVLIGQLHTYN